MSASNRIKNNNYYENMTLYNSFKNNHIKNINKNELQSKDNYNSCSCINF